MLTVPCKKTVDPTDLQTPKIDSSQGQLKGKISQFKTPLHFVRPATIFMAPYSKDIDPYLITNNNE